MPVGRGAHAAASTSPIGMAPAAGVSRGGRARARPRPGRAPAVPTSSTSVFHSPQPGHRPAHLADAAPHSQHR